MPVQSILLLNLVAVIWGTQHAVIKSVIGAGGDNTAAYFTLARFGLAALLTSPYTPGWSLIKKKLCMCMGESTAVVNGEQLQQGQANPDSEQAIVTSTIIDDGESVRLAWKYGAELGLYMFLGYAFQATALETTTASRSGFLLYLNVKFVPFFAYILFGKHIQCRTWISAFVAFTGTAMLAFDNGGTDNALGTAFTVGDLWSIAAAAASAMFILRMEAASKAVPKSSELNAANLWIVAAMSLIWTLGISWNQLSGSEIGVDATQFVHAVQQTFERTISTIKSNPLPLIYLSFVTTALANFLQSKAQKDVSAERAAVIYAMDPVYGAIFANLLLGETLGGLGLAGAFLIFMAAATNAVLDLSGNAGTKKAVEDYTIRRRKGVRNVAIVAHLDHEKATFVDELLKVLPLHVVAAACSPITDEFNNNTESSEEDGEEEERLMDSGELEKEHGITITSKVTRLDYTSSTSDDSSYIINVVDTPSHTDFAGEVDHILSIVDGIVLLVDVGEGPKCQTKYVLFNKADKPESLGRLEGGETEPEVMDLFEALGATSGQMEYLTLFSSARSGWITGDESSEASSMRGLLDAILEDIPTPSVHWYGDRGEEADAKEVSDFANEPFSMTATMVGYDSYLGRTCTGRIYSGQISSGDGVKLLRRQSSDEDSTADASSDPISQLSGVFANQGVSRVALDLAVAYAGDIATLTGVPESMAVGDTLTTADNGCNDGPIIRAIMYSL